MSIKELGTREYGDGPVQQVTLTVDGNVPQKFPELVTTELTFSRRQAFVLWEDLEVLFGGEGIRGEVWSAPLPELPKGVSYP